MRLNYFIIPLFTVAVAVIGSTFTSGGMPWYDTINKPSFTPQGSVIGMVWTIIFILSTISAIIVWNSHAPFGSIPRDYRFVAIISIFLLNGFLNVFWSYLFFNRYLMYAAIWEAIALDITVIVLMVLIWGISRWASLLLLPYACWTAFASFLTYTVYSLNR